MSLDRQQAFTDLLERHRGILFKVAHAYARCLEDRADLTQEIAAQAWRAFPRYDPERPFPTWLYRVALNVAISFARRDDRRRRRMTTLDAGVHDLPESDAVEPERAEHIRALRNFIAGLKPLDRALMLLYLDDQSYRDIAEVLGITETNVATKISRLKQRIRNEL